MPDPAQRISGRTYLFDDNPLGFRRFRLTFDAGSATFEFSFRESNVEVDVGLDGAPCITETEGYVRSYSGEWTDDATFAMTYEIMGIDESGTIEIAFGDDDSATVRYAESFTGVTEVIACRWQRDDTADS